jgi:hypothetical protein
LKITDSNVSENVLFPLACPTNGIVGLWIPSMSDPTLSRWTGLVGTKIKRKDEMAKKQNKILSDYR